jgi:twitching motility protein PilT
MIDINTYFKLAVEKKASDLHLVADSVPALRIAGELVRIGSTPLLPHDLEDAINSIIDEKTKKRFLRKRELDFSKEFSGFRFRINLHFQEGELGLTARLIPEAPNPDSIMFDEVIYRFTHLKDGLIIVTGPSGSGKSTTLAAMINIINKERRSHIITIEDPVEFMFKEEQSIIEQREVGHDTASFAEGLKYALRQDPNVIMVGEMRDLETVRAAITAAETGHLILSTLHTATAPEAVSRIVDVFPAHQQQQVLNQLASLLRGVVAQQLLPKKGGGLVVAREIMINNRAVANLIRRNQFEQIYSVIQMSQKEGMITMNKAIDRLYAGGLISDVVAKNRKRDLETLAVYY